MAVMDNAVAIVDAIANNSLFSQHFIILFPFMFKMAAIISIFVHSNKYHHS